MTIRLRESVAAIALTLLPAPASAATPDQTEDVLLVATLLARLKLGDTAAASRLLARDAVISDT